MIQIWTFGFKYGMPPCNIMFDVTFLPNPARLSGKKLDGALDDEMLTFIQSHAEAHELVLRIADLAQVYVKTGLETRIGLGCNSGRHRSRGVAMMLATELKRRRLDADVRHREDL